MSLKEYRRGFFGRPGVRGKSGDYEDGQRYAADYLDNGPESLADERKRLKLERSIPTDFLPPEIDF